jgi:uncharacterized protein
MTAGGRGQAMTRAGRAAGLAAVLVAALSVAGCASLFERDPVSVDYFVLTPVAAGVTSPIIGGPVFAVGPVSLPQYLTQSAIAIRYEANEIAFAADKQWAGPLSGNISQVLAENLTAMLPSDRVVVVPVGPGVPVDFQVTVDVLRFERQPDGHVALVARWNTFAEGGRRLLGMYRSDLRTPERADEYAAIVSAMSGLLGELAREIAAALQAAGRTMPAPLS